VWATKKETLASSTLREGDDLTGLINYSLSLLRQPLQVRVLSVGKRKETLASSNTRLGNNACGQRGVRSKAECA